MPARPVSLRGPERLPAYYLPKCTRRLPASEVFLRVLGMGTIACLLRVKRHTAPALSSGAGQIPENLSNLPEYEAVAVP